MLQTAATRDDVATVNQQFLKEVMQGLTATPKHLSSKYFYDKAGDRLFQKIMHCPEYYLTDCELEILSEQSSTIARTLKDFSSPFDLVELGAGDASKSIYLLKALLTEQMLKTYFPVDISSNVISQLEEKLPERLPDLQLEGFNGEYMDMLKQINEQSSHRKLVLFLGSNIGNFMPEKALSFCQKLHKNLEEGDLVLIGFDLKKDPGVILSAYNDKSGFTRDFNLNLLKRINQDLHADFDLSRFQHYPTYDPVTGTCKSYLISLADQSVTIKGQKPISLKKYTPIHTEVSQKYEFEETDKLASQSGFRVKAHFLDSKEWFADCLWENIG